MLSQAPPRFAKTQFASPFPFENLGIHKGSTLTLARPSLACPKKRINRLNKTFLQTGWLVFLKK
jgi:hypothetical protein